MLINTKTQNFTSGWPTPGRIRLLLKVSNRNVVALVVVVVGKQSTCGAGGCRNGGKTLEMWLGW